MQIQPNDKVVYLLIRSHGFYWYNKRNFRNIFRVFKEKTFENTEVATVSGKKVYPPDYIDFNNETTRKIEFYQKITYAPFGLYNIIHCDEIIPMRRQAVDLIQSNVIIGEPLFNLIKAQTLISSVEEKMKAYDPNDSRNSEGALEALVKLMEHKDEIYSSSMYVKDDPSNVRLLDKSFMSDLDPERDFMDITVIYQQNGPYEIGDKFNLPPVYTVSIQSMINNISIYYTHIIMIDFSCEQICEPYTKDLVVPEHARNVREMIKTRQLGRGYVKRCKKFKKNKHKQTKKIYK